MSQDLTNLLTRRSNIIAELAAMSNPNTQTITAGGMPTYTKDGQSFDHVGYKNSLYAELGQIQSLIQMIDGAFEVTSEIQ